jgi:hypothetical protein
MGYYSQVAYKIKFAEKDRFIGFITEAKLDPRTMLCFDESEADYFKVLEDECEIRFFVNSCKWYEDYDEVKCHEALLEKVKTYNELADERNEPHPCWYSFARVGETTEDIEERYNGDDVEYDSVNVARYVYVDWM